MKPKLLLILCLLLPAIAVAAPGHNSNIVIENLYIYVKFNPDKTGKGLSSVEQTTQYVFRAKRSADKAFAPAYYNDNITIDKASGGDVSYGSYLGDVFFSDSKACIVKVDLNKAGSRAKATVKRTYKKPEFFTDVMLYEAYDVEHCSVTFEIPESLGGRYRLVERNFPAGFKREEKSANGKLTVTYTIDSMPVRKQFADEPSINVTAPKILVLGHFRDVNDLYRYLNSYIPATDPGAQSVADKAAEITAGCTSDSERIKAVNDFVHESISYVAVEHGDFGHRPDVASEVLRKRFGDCKGSAILLRDMLRSLGIDAHLAWVGTPDVGTDWTDVPNISSGNHMIAAVRPSGDSLIYLDGTSRYSSPAAPPSILSGRQVLVENTADECIVANVPLCPPERNSITESLTFTIDNNTLEAEGSKVYKGSHYETFRSIADGIIPNRRQEYFELMFSTDLHGAKPSEVTCSITSDSVCVAGKATMEGMVKNAGSTVYVNLNLSSRLDGMKFDITERTSGGVIGTPAVFNHTLKLNVPAGMALGDTPAECVIDNEWLKGEVKNIVAPDGSSLTRVLSLTVRQREVSADKIGLYNTDIQRLIRACSSTAVLNKI